MIRRLIPSTTLAALVVALGVRPATAASPQVPPPAGPMPVQVGRPVVPPSSETPPDDPFDNLPLPTQVPAAGLEPEPAPVETPTQVPGQPPSPAEAPPRPLGGEPAVPQGEPTPQVEVPPSELPYRPSADAPLDEQVERVQDPAPMDGSALPVAIERPGTEVPSDAPAGAPLVLTADRIKPGPNSMGVTVEVQAPQVANINLDGELRIIIRNTDRADATNVRVRYLMPEIVEYLDSNGADLVQKGPVYVWQISSLPAGSTKVIAVRVRYKAEGEVDHPVTVALETGSKARTMARAPKLKVELRPSTDKVLKGNRVTFDITVRNDGTHEARDVVLLARLSPGLEYPPYGQDLKLPLKDEGYETLPPGQAVPIKLEVDAKAMGLQSCEVVVTSPDMGGEATMKKEVEVIEPKLQVTLEGPDTRYPETNGTYTLNVTNVGTAPAIEPVMAMLVPMGGTPLRAMPEGARFMPERRTLYWREKEIPAGETRQYRVEVKMGPVGSLPVRAGAKASGVDQVTASKTTQIEGLPKIKPTVSQTRQVVDEGEETDYQITLENVGTRDALNVLVTARFTDNLQVVSVRGPDGKEEAQNPADGRTATLPHIDRLPPGGKVVVSVRARGTKAGVGRCEILFTHDDLPGDPLSAGSEVTRVMPASNVRR